MRAGFWLCRSLHPRTRRTHDLPEMVFRPPYVFVSTGTPRYAAREPGGAPTPCLQAPTPTWSPPSGITRFAASRRGSAVQSSSTCCILDEPADAVNRDIRADVAQVAVWSFFRRLLRESESCASPSSLCSSQVRVHFFLCPTWTSIAMEVRARGRAQDEGGSGSGWTSSWSARLVFLIRR